MGLISRLYNFVSGGAIYSSEINAEYDQILAVLNGNIDGANIASSAVTESKLGLPAVAEVNIHPSAVTEDKIAESAVTNEKIAANAVTGAKTNFAGDLSTAFTTAATTIQEEVSLPCLFASDYSRELFYSYSDKIVFGPITGVDQFGWYPVPFVEGAILKNMSIYGMTEASTSSTVLVTMYRRNSTGTQNSILDCYMTNSATSSADWTAAAPYETMERGYSYFIEVNVRSVFSAGATNLGRITYQYTTDNLGQ